MNEFNGSIQQQIRILFRKQTKFYMIYFSIYFTLTRKRKRKTLLFSLLSSSVFKFSFSSFNLPRLFAQLFHIFSFLSDLFALLSHFSFPSPLFCLRYTVFTFFYHLSTASFKNSYTHTYCVIHKQLSGLYILQINLFTHFD